jgi:hypothetical protein
MTAEPPCAGLGSRSGVKRFLDQTGLAIQARD